MEAYIESGSPHRRMQFFEFFDRENSWFGVANAVVFFQILCVIHVLKTGRPYWWILVVLMLPIAGVIAYIIVEVMPDRHEMGLHDILWRLKPPGARLSFLRAQVEETDSVQNRTALAEEMTRQGLHAEAAEEWKECLTGAFKDDPRLLLYYAAAKLESGEAKEARDLLAKVEPGRDRRLETRKRLLGARVAAALGERDTALPLLAEMATSLPGEEARFYYGRTLLESGQKQEAKQVFDAIALKYRKSGALWRKSEKRWFALAKRLRKECRSV